MGKGSSPPAAPDPTATANAQFGLNKDTALFNTELNRFNVQTPFGSQTWIQGAPTKTFNQGRYDQAAAASPGAANTWDWNTNSMVPGSAPNAPDRNDPQFYDTTPSTGWTQQINLNPTSQATLDQTQNNGLDLAKTQGRMLSNASEQMGSPINTSNLPGMQNGVNYNGPGFASSVNANGPGYAGPVAQGDLSGLANKATNAAFDSSMALLSPQMDIQRKQQMTDLANRGIPVGSEGYQNQMGSLDRQQDFTRAQAANNATLTGMQYDNQLFNQGTQNAGLQNAAQEGTFNQGLNSANLQNAAQQSGFNQALSQGGFANSAQAQAMQQMLALRNQPLNEYNAMMQGTQVQTPQFQSTPAVSAQAPNYEQAVQNQYQGQLNAYNAQTGSSNSMMSGLMAMAPYLMMALA